MLRRPTVRNAGGVPPGSPPAASPASRQPASSASQDSAGAPSIDGNVPAPAVERAPWLVALCLLLVGAGVLAAVVSGAIGRPTPTPPPLLIRVSAPSPAATVANPATGHRRYVSNTAPAHRPAVVAAPPERASSRAAALAAKQGSDALQVPVPASWIAGFYPIYEQAQKAFGVNWLLIASIHRQETAFSTAPGTYHGLNFAGCCGGPMQFNVKDGPVSTWATVADSYRYGRRPSVYDHRTAKHPSIYDDFDSIMAAAHLLSLDGAGYGLNDAAWWAAYDYYGHDEYGVTYADQVIARAISWSQHGFCPDCGTSGKLLSAVYAAYGAPVLAALRSEASDARQAKARSSRRGGHASRRAHTARRVSPARRGAGVARRYRSAGGGGATRRSG